MSEQAEKNRIPLAEAEELAASVVTMLLPFCKRIEIAGSIRRKKPDVGDIEIVCVPKLVDGHLDLFGDPAGIRNIQFEQISELCGRGIFKDRLDVNGRPARGERFQRLIFRGFPLDIFCVLPPAQWGVIFTIRTGPASFSHRAVTSRLQGGKLPPGHQIKDGQLLIEGRAVEVPEERDFFRLNEMNWIEPEARV